MNNQDQMGKYLITANLVASLEEAENHSVIGFLHHLEEDLPEFLALSQDAVTHNIHMGTALLLPLKKTYRLMEDIPEIHGAIAFRTMECQELYRDDQTNVAMLRYRWTDGITVSLGDGQPHTMSIADFIGYISADMLG